MQGFDTHVYTHGRPSPKTECAMVEELINIELNGGLYEFINLALFSYYSHEFEFPHGCAYWLQWEHERSELKQGQTVIVLARGIAL